MFADFDTYIKDNIKLSDDDLKLMRSMALERQVRRKEVLLQEGEICRYKIFVTSGLLRMYRTREDGNEHTMQFASENSWITEPESLNNQTPTSYNIEALEDCELLLWTKRDFEHLFIAIPGLKAYSDDIITKNLSMTRERMFNTISASAEGKYEDFIRNYPQIFRRIPLHMVASYLGVSLKTLSRVRHAQVKR